MLKKEITLKTISVFFLFQSFWFASIAVGQMPTTTTEIDDDWFSGNIYWRPRWVENATGTAVEETQINEFQNELGLVLDADWQSSISSASLSYEAATIRYEDDSQPDDETWSGNSAFVLGNISTVGELAFEHSIRRILREPGAAPVLLANSEERQIYTVRPLLRTRLGGANQAAAVFYYSEVDFANSGVNDSQRTGMDVVLTRFVSPIREVSLILGQREIDYDTSDDADYELNSVSARMTAEHRRFDYRVEVGVARLEPEIGDDTDRTNFDFLLNSRIVGNLFSLFFNRAISDSSLGNDNSQFFSDEVSFDAALSERDQVERTTLGVAWVYELLCQRCSLSLALGVEDVDFLTLSENDSEQTFVEFGFGYRFSPRFSANTSTRVIDTTFDDEASLRDTETQITRFDFVYEFNPSFDITLQHEIDRREAEAFEPFDVNTTSLRMTYYF